jgi:hypothetical protein
MNAVQRRHVFLYSSWLVSAILHFAVILVVAVVHLPGGKGKSSASTLIVSLATADPDELEVATLAGLALELGPGEDAVAAGGALDKGDMAGETLDSEIPDLTELVLPKLDRAPQIPPSELASLDLTVPALPVASPLRRDAATDEQPPAARAEFFGSVAQGDRFVYVLDMSTSMALGGDASKSRFARAREELLRSIDQLLDRQGFYVVLFSDKAQPMFDEAGPQRQFLRATPENKDRLRDWLMKIVPNGGTHPNESLDLAVSLAPSAIFMLSDGEFEADRPKPAATLFKKAGGNRNEIIDRSNERLIPIHSIAYEDSSAAKNMLQLSKETGGSYRFVPAAGSEGQAQFIPAVAPPAPMRPAAADEMNEVADSPAPALALLDIAQEHEARHRYRQALEAYRRVVAQFPGTTVAAEAKKAARRLNSKRK